jgi:hypothetical protein
MKKHKIQDEEAELPVSQSPPSKKQLLPKEADEYIKESANIEDMPDPEQVEKAEKQFKRSGSEK